MINLYKKIIIFSLTIFSFVFSFSFAQEPDAFVVKVDPDTFGVGQAVDITISAVKNGVILKDYIGDIFIEVVGIDSNQYTAPSDGFYPFLIQDQGVRLFSKGLEIKKAGTYQVRVSDFIEETILGQTTVIVGNINDNEDLRNINITSPINSSTERRSTINVIGSSFELRNSPIEIYLNNALAGSSNTDSMGNFNVYISDLQSGQNQIQAKVTNINDILLGESTIITINYEPPSDGVFNSIEILPSGSLKEGDKATFNIYVAEDVTSVEMKFSDGKTYPLDRVSPGIFKKEIVMTDPGSKDVSISLIFGLTSKDYKNVASFFIKENQSVGSVKFVSTGVDGTSVIVSWSPIGISPQYRVSYGTDRNNLQKSVDVNSTGILIDNLQIDVIYYFQILPLDDGLHASGDPSEIVEYNPKEVYASCVVKGIIITSEKIGDKYFLVWDAAENVTKYEIYRSDREDMSDMKKVGETEDTRFEYFFDKYSEKDQYAYYQVQAVCEDGSSVIIDEAQKVQVGPFENTLLIIVITLFFYSVYKLYRTVE